jgi:hypothetical protein
MVTSFGFVVLACFLTGTAIVLALALRTTGSRGSGANIAQVLYETENPGEPRERTPRRS